MATNGILQAVLQTMDENAPWHFAIVADKNDDVSRERCAIELGLTRGYSKYGDVLRLLADPIHASAQAGETSYDPPPQPPGKVT